MTTFYWWVFIGLVFFGVINMVGFITDGSGWNFLAGFVNFLFAVLLVTRPTEEA